MAERLRIPTMRRMMPCEHRWKRVSHDGATWCPECLMIWADGPPPFARVLRSVPLAEFDGHARWGGYRR